MTGTADTLRATGIQGWSALRPDDFSCDIPQAGFIQARKDEDLISSPPC
jgi:hypothetical protein